MKITIEKTADEVVEIVEVESVDPKVETTEVAPETHEETTPEAPVEPAA